MHLSQRQGKPGRLKRIGLHRRSRKVGSRASEVDQGLGSVARMNSAK